MKHLIIAIVAVMACLAADAQTGVDAMAKQRARDVANKNNNRSMDPNAYTGAAPTPAATAPATPQPMNSAQQAYARFQASLLALNTNSTDATKQQFAGNLAAVAQGANKPSPAATSKLSQHLAEALSESKLSSTKKIHVAQGVAVLMNSANKTPEQAQAGIKDVQSTLESGGISSENASAVAADLQAVVDEIQKPAAK
jgi:hypothetical protein